MRRVFCLLLALLTLLAPLRIVVGGAAECCDPTQQAMPVDHSMHGGAEQGEPQDVEGGCPCEQQCASGCLHGAQPAAASGLALTRPPLATRERPTLRTRVATLAAIPPTPPPRPLSS